MSRITRDESIVPPDAEDMGGTDALVNYSPIPEDLLYRAGVYLSDNAGAMLYYLTVFLIPIFAIIVIVYHVRATKLMMEAGLKKLERAGEDTWAIAGAKSILTFAKGQTFYITILAAAAVPCYVLAMIFWRIPAISIFLFVPFIFLLVSIKPTNSLKVYLETLPPRGEVQDLGLSGLKRSWQAKIFTCIAYGYSQVILWLVYPIAGMGTTLIVLLLNPFLILAWILSMLTTFYIGQFFIEANDPEYRVMAGLDEK